MSMKNKFKFMLSPWSIIAGLVAGVLIGIYFKGSVQYLKPLGDVYIAVLKMCVVPIMASAVVISLSKLLKSKETSRYLRRIIAVFALSLVGVALIGLFSGMAMMPLMGDDADIRTKIGQKMIEKDDDDAMAGDAELKVLIVEIDSRQREVVAEEDEPLIKFFIGIIPANIFAALTREDTLKIVFFFIVLGVLVKFIPDRHGDRLITLFEGVFECFQTLIKFAMYFLPVGLCALLAVQFSETGLSEIKPLMALIVLIYIASLAIFLVSSIVIWKFSGKPYLLQFKALKDAILIAMGTRSSYAALPSAISGLCHQLELDRDRTNLTVPLGFALCKFGKVLIFCIGAVFAAHLYDRPLDPGSILIIIVSSILAGMAASGAPSIVSRGMIAMVLVPLGIPAEAIIVILLAIDPLIDPVITLISTYPNYAAAAIIAGNPASSHPKGRRALPILKPRS